MSVQSKGVNEGVDEAGPTRAKVVGFHQVSGVTE